MAGDRVDESAQTQGSALSGFLSIPTLLTYDHGVGSVNVPYPADSVEARVYAKNKDSEGHLFIHVNDGQGHSGTADLGTGFFLDKDGLMATDNHVVTPTTFKWTDDGKNYRFLPVVHFSIGVVTSDGAEHQATVIQDGRNPASDSALIQVSPLTPGEIFKPVTLSQSSHLKELEPVFVLGYPLKSEALTLSPGTTQLFGSDAAYGQFQIQDKGNKTGDPVLSAPTRRVLEVDANVKQGESGGPAFDKDGQVIGKIEMVSTTPDSMPIAILTTVEDLNALIAHAHRTLPSLPPGTLGYTTRYTMPQSPSGNKTTSDWEHHPLDSMLKLFGQ